MPEGGSGTAMEVSKIVLKLETNFQEVLKKQINSFDKFTRDANQLTRQVGTNMNQLARHTSTSFSTMFKGNKREVQELVSFTRSALQGVRHETIKIQQMQDRFQGQVTKRYTAMRKQMAQLKGSSMQIKGADISDETKTGLLKKIKGRIEQVKAQYEKDIAHIEKLTTQTLVKNLANAVNEAMKTIEKGSRAAAVTVNNVVKDMQSRFNQLYSQRKFMGQADFAEAGAGFLKQRAAQIKVLENLLKQHQKKQVQAEQYLQKQKQLLSQQTNKTLYNQQKQMVDKARAVVKRLGSEYEFMFNKIQSFARGQTAITGVFEKQAQQSLGGIKQALRGVNLKRDFAKMWENLEGQARLSGERAGQAFFDAARKGKALDNALKEKTKLMEGLLLQAKTLQSSGLIDARRQIRSLQSVIGKIKEFRGEFAKTKKEIISIPNISQQKFAAGGIDQARKLADEVRLVIGSMRQMGKVNEDNVINTQISLRRLQSLYKQHANKVAQSQRTIAQLDKELDRARLMGATATTEASINAWNSYYLRVKAIRRRLLAEMKRSVLPANPLKQMEAETIATVNRIRRSIAKDLIPINEIRNTTNILKREFDSVGERVDNLSRKRLIKTEQLKFGFDYVAKLKTQVESYNGTIRKLNTSLERLKRLQRAGLGGEGVTNQIQQTKNQMMMLQQQVRQYERMQIGMMKRMETARRQSIKGQKQGLWEMIRNFRWQVAAVIYLVTRAIWFINRTVIKMLDNIAQYRKDAMSLAAAISFQMVESSREAYDKAYSYARKLMLQLEMVAAETILSLEDMVMLTKTFAQAGIVPKTEEDVRRIATIGTAIKALTEGMANAGVQMRQELYAVIQGRQRATDQLAKMFQVMGINISKLIEDGKKEGKDMITVLSDALEPFAQMNERMKDEWAQVKNRIQVVWGLIQRIGGEDFLVRWSKELNALLDTFVTKAEDGFYRLTERGAMWASWITATLNTFKAVFDILVAIVDVTEAVLLAISGIVQNIADAAMIFAGFEDQVKKNRSQWDGLIMLLQVFVQGLNMVAQALKFIAALVKSVAIEIKVWIDRIVALYGIYKSLKKGDTEGAGKFYDDFVNKGKKANEDIKNIWLGENGWIRSSWRSLDGVNQQFEKMRDHAAGINDEFGKTPDLFKLPNNVVTLGERVAKLAPKLKQVTLAGMEGPEKFAKELEFEIADPDEIKTKLQENIKKLDENIQGALTGKFKTDPKKLTFWVNTLTGHKQSLAEMNNLTDAALKKHDKQVSDWNEKQRKKMAGWTREYKDLLTSISPKDLTKTQKTDQWFEKMSNKLEELRVKNPLVAKEFKNLSKALDDALGRRRVDDTKAINDEMEKLKLKLTSHRPVDTISKINDEFAKMKLEIINNKDFIERGLVPEMLKLWGITKKERIEVEKLNMTYKASGAELDVMSKRAEFMTGAYSPAKRMQGEINLLKINHKKAMEDIQKEIDTTYRIWVEDGQWATREGSAEAQRYVQALQEQMVELTKVTERELRKKQFPIWNDLVEASNNWADGFTDALSNIVDGVGSVSEALQELQAQILKDVLKTVIKRSITDQLQSALGSGEGSPMEGFFGLFPGGKKDIGKKGGATEITASKPIPVTVYNPQDLMDSTVKAVEPMSKIPIPEEVGLGMRVFVTNWPIGGEGMGAMLGGTGSVVSQGVQGVSQDLADISSEIAENTAKAEESTRSWYSGITDVFSNIGNWFKGLFGGGGAAGGGGSSMNTIANLGMMAASAYGMADGGVISEPIVGKGLESGQTYNFGERAKYGENEIVAPIKKMQRSVAQNKVEYHMPIHLSAIDTQSGTQFLMKHSDVIQGQMIKNLRQNKPIRKGIQNAY